MYISRKHSIIETAYFGVRTPTCNHISVYNSHITKLVKDRTVLDSSKHPRNLDTRHHIFSLLNLFYYSGKKNKCYIALLLQNG